jgi:hypothetical protein
MTWIDDFRTRYQTLLTPTISGAKRGLQEGIGVRFPGFELMFQMLWDRGSDWYNIIETGTLRRPGNWKDGQSAVLFTDFVAQTGGTVCSVDIDDEACQAARRAIPDARFQVYCLDSVEWLNQRGVDLEEVDLFYLDSWDVKWGDDQPSAEHHLREFQAIEGYLKRGAIVAIDDNARFLDGRRTGKGRCIVEYLERQGRRPIYDAYQIIYQF